MEYVFKKDSEWIARDNEIVYGNRTYQKFEYSEITKIHFNDVLHYLEVYKGVKSFVFKFYDYELLDVEKIVEQITSQNPECEVIVGIPEEENKGGLLEYATAKTDSTIKPDAKGEIYYCFNCNKVYSSDDFKKIQHCPTCAEKMYNTEIKTADWRNKTPEEKEEEKERLHDKIEAIRLEQARILEERRKKIEEQEQIVLSGAYKKVEVTTCDSRRPYKIIGPVYFQINDGGSQYSKLARQYREEILEWQVNGMDSGDNTSLMEWLGIASNLIDIFKGRPGDRDLLGNNHQNFDLAFYIACEELKKRAAFMGADAVIGMRQDIDLDSNGFQHFYLQMYGTAVKYTD